MRLAKETKISIHAPREGSDHFRAVDEAVRWISIHAPREGSDGETRATGSPPANFYPRSPRGERPYYRQPQHRLSRFLSTLPARGATHFRAVDEAVRWISIHAPREGSDGGKRGGKRA